MKKQKSQRIRLSDILEITFLRKLILKIIKFPHLFAAVKNIAR